MKNKIFTHTPKLTCILQKEHKILYSDAYQLWHTEIKWEKFHLRTAVNFPLSFPLCSYEYKFVVTITVTAIVLPQLVLEVKAKTITNKNSYTFQKYISISLFIR